MPKKNMPNRNMRRMRARIRRLLPHYPPEKGRKTLFYPECGADLEPLRRLRHLFDTFILCDRAAREEDWTLKRVKLRLADQAPDFQCEAREAERYLGQEEIELIMGNAHQRRPPWGKLFSLTARNAGRHRMILLVYLAIEPVVAYHNLFTIRNFNALGVCFKRYRGCGAKGWTAFDGWNKPLGRLIHRIDPLPTYLITVDWQLGHWPVDPLAGP